MPFFKNYCYCIALSRILILCWCSVCRYWLIAPVKPIPDFRSLEFLYYMDVHYLSLYSKYSSFHVAKSLCIFCICVWQVWKNLNCYVFFSSIINSSIFLQVCVLNHPKKHNNVRATFSCIFCHIVFIKDMELSLLSQSAMFL